MNEDVRFLSEAGMSFRWVAHAAKISQSEMNKMKRGMRSTHEKEVRDFRLFVDSLIPHLGHVHDVASWLETPVHEETYLTPYQMCGAGYTDVTFQVAAGVMAVEEALDVVKPGWREGRKAEVIAFPQPA